MVALMVSSLTSSGPPTIIAASWGFRSLGPLKSLILIDAIAKVLVVNRPILPADLLIIERKGFRRGPGDLALAVDIGDLEVTG